MFSIRAKILLLVTSLVFLIIAAILYRVYHSTYQHSEQQIELKFSSAQKVLHGEQMMVHRLLSQSASVFSKDFTLE